MNAKPTMVDVDTFVLILLVVISVLVKVVLH